MGNKETKKLKKALALLGIEPCVNGYIVTLFNQKRVFGSEDSLKEWIGDLFLRSITKEPGISRIFNFTIISAIENVIQKESK